MASVGGGGGRLFGVIAPIGACDDWWRLKFDVRLVYTAGSWMGNVPTEGKISPLLALVLNW
jgi:hypothetical protein